MKHPNATADCDNEDCDGETCTECCPHDDLDDGHCMSCGEDRTEWLMCRAYDMAKDSKYD